MIAQGEVWWADLGEPLGSEPGLRRPVIVVQGDALNRSRLNTAICIPLTSNLAWAAAPSCLPIKASASGLDRDSVAQCALIVAIDKVQLVERVGRITARQLQALLARLDVALGR
jgi:mRNA interferase MazF